MSCPWFQIVECFRLGDRPACDDEAFIDGWRSLAIAFIAVVRIQADREYLVRVDAFPLLYELMKAASSLAEGGNIEVLVGEGICLEGTFAAEGLDIRISFEAGGRDDTLLRQSLSRDDTEQFISRTRADLIGSLEVIDANIEHLLSTFSPDQYRRGISS